MVGGGWQCDSGKAMIALSADNRYQRESLGSTGLTDTIWA